MYTGTSYLDYPHMHLVGNGFVRHLSVAIFLRFSRVLKLKYLHLLSELLNQKTGQASQNDRLNLSFVTDNHIVGQNWPEMVAKWPFILSDSFPTRVYILDQHCQTTKSQVP